jgi:DNA-binding beta-propeller fold protein YncE
MMRRFVGVLLFALMWAAVLSVGQVGDSAQTAAVSLSASLPDGLLEEMFNGTCMMTNEGQQGKQNLPVDPSLQDAKRGGDLTPVRSIIDPYPSFNGIALDPLHDRVVMSDTNKKRLLIYDRASGDTSAQETAPLQQIIGPATHIGFMAGVAMDAPHREIYAVNNDIEDRLVVFSYDDEGSQKPRRILHVPYSSWGVAVHPAREELAVSVQQINAVVIYRREAHGLEAPVRSLIGRDTGLADPHGIYWDEANNEIWVTNHGNTNKEGTTLSSTDYYNSEAGLALRLGGEFHAPSIRVYAATANGNARPLRTIEGPLTQLDWPMGLAVDTVNNVVAVANSVDDSVLIYARTGNGDQKPLRVIKGRKTGITRPMGVAVDVKNNELWVANFGDHSAVVFDLKAHGNVAPKRIVRNAPSGMPTVGMGNPMALAFDSKRDQLLVGN